MARPDTSEKLIAGNPKARSDYFIEEVVEAGMVLTGTEIKSLRTHPPNIKEAFVEFSGRPTGKKLEAWLVHCHISPYSHGNIWNHEPERKRKLLLHRNQIEKLYEASSQDGKTIIPLRMYFKSGRAKIELGLGKGKKHYDKRQDIKKKTAKREMDRAIKENR